MVKKPNIKIPAIVVIRLIIFLLIGLILFWIYSRTRDFLLNAPMFDVKQVLWEQSISFIDQRPLKALKGQNIFTIDLSTLHRQINNQYPQISQLRIVRVFPNTIKVLAKKRDILLQVQSRSKYLLVDTEGVPMFYTAEPVPFPIVRGVPLGKKRVVLGVASQIKELTFIIDLLKQLKSHTHTSRLKILTVEIANLSKIELTVMPNIKIIIDQDRFIDKVEMLEILLQNGKISWNEVKYIDIRFKEPIIKQNNLEDKK